MLLKMEKLNKSTVSSGVLSRVSFCWSSTYKLSSVTDENGLIYKLEIPTVVFSFLDR